MASENESKSGSGSGSNTSSNDGGTTTDGEATDAQQKTKE